MYRTAIPAHRKSHWHYWVLVSAALTVQGCGLWLPVWTVEAHKPDPLRTQAVKVVDFSGGTVTLADHRRFALAGVSWDGPVPSSQPADAVEKTRSAMVVGRMVVPLIESGGKARLLCVSMGETTEYYGPACPLLKGTDYHETDVSAVVLIPVLKEVRRPRQDVGLQLIYLGLAKAKPEEISDSVVRKEYEKAAKVRDPAGSSSTRPAG